MSLFDVHEFAASAHGSLRAEVPDAVVLDGESARLVELLRALEAATMAHLRNVLVTPTHKDARVTAFLVSWAFEKFWIADALGAVVGRGASADLPGTPGTAPASASQTSSSRTPGPLRRSIVGAVSGTAVVAAHMTQGLVDDTILDGAYEELSSRAEALQPLTARIRSIKDRHTRFFGEEARRRLAESGRAVRATLRTLRREPQPIGSGAWGTEQRALFTRLVFDGAAGHERRERIARVVADLPGVGMDAAARLVDDLTRNADGRR